MFSLPQFRKPPPPDDCGTCTACCLVQGVRELGKPFYSICPHMNNGCGIYETRPQSCRDYRCAWHLGMLGPRVDRRPDHVGVVFEFESVDGRWALAISEVEPGAAFTEKTRYLCNIVLTSKQARHLPMTSPPVRVYSYGADIPIDFEVSDYYDYKPARGSMPMRPEGNAMVFAGKCRDVLLPRNLRSSAKSQKKQAG